MLSDVPEKHAAARGSCRLLRLLRVALGARGAPMTELQLEIAKTVREAYVKAIAHIKQGQGSDPILTAAPLASRVARGWAPASKAASGL